MRISHTAYQLFFGTSDFSCVVFLALEKVKFNVYSEKCRIHTCGWLCDKLENESTLLKISREFPGGLVVNIPDFTVVAQAQALVEELKSCRVAKKKKRKTPDVRSNTRRTAVDSKQWSRLYMVSVYMALENPCKSYEKIIKKNIFHSPTPK